MIKQAQKTCCQVDIILDNSNGYVKFHNMIQTQSYFLSVTSDCKELIKLQRQGVSKNLLSGHYLSDIILDNRKSRL